MGFKSQIIGMLLNIGVSGKALPNGYTGYIGVSQRVLPTDNEN